MQISATLPIKWRVEIQTIYP